MATSFIEDEVDTHQRANGDYYFKFQFFVHECQLLKDFFNLGKPALALRFLDFPTLILEGSISPQNTLKFSHGKKCNFLMNSDLLRLSLSTKPFFVMFIDASTQK